jgi:hypothetical protein
MPLVEKARQQLPAMIVDHLPDSVDDLRVGAVDLARKHAATLQLAGKGAARAFVHILIGLVLGAIIALSAHASGASSRATRRGAGFALSATGRSVPQHRVCAGQDLADQHHMHGDLPARRAADPGCPCAAGQDAGRADLCVGLLPVIGNLLSNTAITIAALSVSLGVGIRRSRFLIVIHKLEYFLNARIVGTQIHARAWELLIAMLLMEAAFGWPASSRRRSTRTSRATSALSKCYLQERAGKKIFIFSKLPTLRGV